MGKFDGKNRFIAKSMEVNRSVIEIKMEMQDLLIFVVSDLLNMLVAMWNPITEGLSTASG